MSLNENQIFYVLNYNSSKKICDTLELIYGVFQSIEQERMNTRGKEYECFLHKFFQPLEILEIMLELSSQINI